MSSSSRQIRVISSDRGHTRRVGLGSQVDAFTAQTGLIWCRVFRDERPVLVESPPRNEQGR